jgi:hypothetical protein
MVLEYPTYIGTTTIDGYAHIRTDGGTREYGNTLASRPASCFSGSVVVIIIVVSVITVIIVMICFCFFVDRYYDISRVLFLGFVKLEV